MSLKVGDKICPRIGDFRNITSIVKQVGRVSRGSRELGTRRGELFVLAEPGPELPAQARGIVWLRRRDFNIGPCPRFELPLEREDLARFRLLGKFPVDDQ